MTDESNETRVRSRLEYLRAELRAERISQGELIELQGLAEHIEPGDVELLEAAGVPEHPTDKPDDTFLILTLSFERASQGFACWCECEKDGTHSEGYGDTIAEAAANAVAAYDPDNDELESGGKPQ